jgi:hypothetical protein
MSDWRAKMSKNFWFSRPRHALATAALRPALTDALAVVPPDQHGATLAKDWRLGAAADASFRPLRFVLGPSALADFPHRTLV